MRRWLWIVLVMLWFTPAFGQTLVPKPGGTPDYFGLYPNWAFSPLPTVSGGTINPDGTVSGGTVTGGIRKFVDSLPKLNAANNLGQVLPIAVPDRMSYPGSDYYVIELRQYSEKMHSDLPPTTLRGYVQVNAGTDAKGNPVVAPAPIHFLGPVIVTQKDRPVRIKFTNKLPTGAGGDLFLPVDKTVMGAGPGPNIPETMYANTRHDQICRDLPAGCYTENRSAIHLHGATTPWISDGTPHQWITPAGETTAYPKGVSVYNVPDMPDPGDGSLTFYYTNQQSARLMFYHDHTLGLTRLNVYAGEAGGYVNEDPTEQGLVASGILPAEQIPLILQDKTFVDAATIAATDPTWNWGTGALDPATGIRTPQTGDLWLPHVYMPNQNPYDISGTNPVGRWDYGPWFWPPFTGLQYGEIPNPYFDPGCIPSNTTYCEPPNIPGTPNPSVVPETFLDTPVINGTAYPYVEVEPKAYRFRILNGANDRFWNLQLYVADSTVLSADGRANTEVRMVSFDRSHTPGFPASWGKMDLRDGGVPDPASVGPRMIQIGTEGGFLPAPVAIENRPVNYEYDRRNVIVLNVKEKALFLGPAERADVIVDFSQFAGKTLILYNDAPAPVPAADPRLDYYTGKPDHSMTTGDGTGGSPTTLVGYGPNTRTLLQIRVSGTANGTPYNLAALQSALPGAFLASQEPVIVPQAAYNHVYGTKIVDKPGVNFARIQDTAMTFTPQGQTLPLTMEMEPKSIIEDFQPDYGRMNSILGVEVKHTNNTNQTSIIQEYIDPPTEIVKVTNPDRTPIGAAADGTQIWKVTHNGVDTHAIHFHMFHVQIVNRVGWDGAIRAPDANELGWKDTVRMNPLEDIVIALRPIVLNLPFQVANSIRPLAPSMPLNATIRFTGIDPAGNPVTFANSLQNFGWEYVWHCHLLGHEENDMMRAMVVAVPPETPSNLTPMVQDSSVVLKWIDNSLTASGFTVQRAEDSGFTAGLTSWTLGQVNTFTDTSPPTSPTLYYRVYASNTVGSTVPGYPTVTTDSSYSGAVQVIRAPIAGLSPTSLKFTNQEIHTTSPAQSVLLSNTGNMPLTFTSVITGTHAGDFAQTNTCGGTVAAGSKCSIDVTFTPAAQGVRSATLSLKTNDTTHPQLNVSLQGVGTLMTAPSAPSQLAGSAVRVRGNTTQDLVALTWTDNAGNETGFQLQRSLTPFFSAPTTYTLGANVTTFSQLVPRANNYYYRVRAINAGGNSAWSNSVFIRTP